MLVKASLASEMRQFFHLERENVERERGLKTKVTGGGRRVDKEGVPTTGGGSGRGGFGGGERERRGEEEREGSH